MQMIMKNTELCNAHTTFNILCSAVSIVYTDTQMFHQETFVFEARGFLSHFLMVTFL